MNHPQKQNILHSACLLAMAALLSTAPIQGAWAQTAPALGTASSFAVLGGAGVTCTTGGVAGDVGSLLTVTGFPPPAPALCTLVGTVHAGDAAAIAANSDFLLAYAVLADNTATSAYKCPSADASHNLSGDLGGLTLSPGVYCISGVGLLGSQLTLKGHKDAVWIFKADTSITAINGSVVMKGGQACNVYWETGTLVSLDATDFLGNILAGSAISFTGVGSSLVGRALAQTAVTMTGATVSECGKKSPKPPKS